MDNKTPGNIKYGDMPADYRMRYKQMIEKHNKNKDKNKKTEEKVLLIELQEYYTEVVTNEFIRKHPRKTQKN